MKRQQFIILRGNPATGKSTIAEELRKNFNKKTAVIHTIVFYFQIVNGDSPEIAMENTRRIVDNYLKNGYNVILEGTLSYKDKKGKLYLDNFIKLGNKYNINAKVFFLKADLNVLINREKKRKLISLNRLKYLYNITNKSKNNKDIFIDTTKISIEVVIKKIKGALK